MEEKGRGKRRRGAALSAPRCRARPAFVKTCAAAATPEPAWPQTRPRQGRRERQRRLKRCCRAGRGLQARCNGRRSGLRPSAARSPVVLRRRPGLEDKAPGTKGRDWQRPRQDGGRASATSAAIPPRSTLASAFPSTTLALEETLVIAARLAFARCSWGAARRPPQALRGWRCDGLLGGWDFGPRARIHHVHIMSAIPVASDSS